MEIIFSTIPSQFKASKSTKSEIPLIKTQHVNTFGYSFFYLARPVFTLCVDNNLF